MTDPAPSLPALLPRIERAVRAAAVPVMKHFSRRDRVFDKDLGEEIRVTEARAGNPVTEADLAADAVLRELLPRLLPGSGWLSEETADSPTRLGCEWVWIVDPIDGTREYVEGVPEFAISVALARRGEPVLGVLFNPAANDLISGGAGLGVRRNGRAVSASAQDGLDGAVLVASRTEARRGEFEAFAERLEIREVGSTAWKLGLVASGEADLYFTRKPRNEWDVAAGVALCRAGGASVLDLGGDPHRFNRRDPLCRGVVAAAPGLMEPVMAWIGDVGTLE